MAKEKHTDAPPVPATPPMFKDNSDELDSSRFKTPPAAGIPPNDTLVRKKPERTALSGDLQAAAKIDRLLNKMPLDAAIGTLEYLVTIYLAKRGPV